MLSIDTFTVSRLQVCPIHTDSCCCVSVRCWLVVVIPSGVSGSVDVTMLMISGSVWFSLVMDWSTGIGSAVVRLAGSAVKDVNSTLGPNLDGKGSLSLCIFSPSTFSTNLSVVQMSGKVVFRMTCC